MTNIGLNKCGNIQNSFEEVLNGRYRESISPYMMTQIFFLAPVGTQTVVGFIIINYLSLSRSGNIFDFNNSLSIECMYRVCGLTSMFLSLL